MGAHDVSGKHQDASGHLPSAAEPGGSEQGASRHHQRQDLADDALASQIQKKNFLPDEVVEDLKAKAQKKQPAVKADPVPRKKKEKSDTTPKKRKTPVKKEARYAAVYRLMPFAPNAPFLQRQEEEGQEASTRLGGR